MTQAILNKQKGMCPICGHKLGAAGAKLPALDHDHDTGYVRDVLCVNCNGIEGRLKNLLRRIGKHMTAYEVAAAYLRYWERHRTSQWGGLLHHTHKTDEEKRKLRLAKAAAQRRAKKLKE